MAFCVSSAPLYLKPHPQAGLVFGGGPEKRGAGLRLERKKKSPYMLTVTDSPAVTVRSVTKDGRMGQPEVPRRQKEAYHRRFRGREVEMKVACDQRRGYYRCFGE